MSHTNTQASIDIGEISSILEKDAEGIWVSPSRHEISYPRENNAICFGMEDDSFWYAHRTRCIEALVRKFLRQAPLFDIGGGNGVVSRALHNAGIETYLVEPGRAGIMNARSRGLDNLICAAFEDCGFHSNVIPAVGLFDILEHIVEDKAFLAAVHDTLIPNGSLFLSVPAYPLLWSNFDVQVGHIRRYTLRQICRQLEQTGFQVEFATYIFSILPFPILLRRTLPSKLGLYKNITPQVKRDEHQPRMRTLTKAFGWLLEKELAQVRRQKVIPLGSSCLVAARKK